MSYSETALRRMTFAAVLTVFSAPAFAQEGPVQLLPTIYGMDHLPVEKISAVVQEVVDISQYRKVTAQVIQSDEKTPDHIVVRLYSTTARDHDIARIDVDPDYNPTGFAEDHKLGALHNSNIQRMSLDGSAYSCPDGSVQFLSVVPSEPDNVGSFEQEKAYAMDVANHAIAKGYKTKLLAGADATTENFANYLSCPNLVGVFYDGDANEQEIETHDGGLTASIITDNFEQALQGITAIMLACEAFNDPMLSAMKGAKLQVYAAGINSLSVGPSDRTAVCAMKAALDGKPMKAAFDACQAQNDVSRDQWGYFSNGSDIFGN